MMHPLCALSNTEQFFGLARASIQHLYCNYVARRCPTAGQADYIHDYGSGVQKRLIAFGRAVLIFNYLLSFLRSQSAKTINIESESTMLPQAKIDYRSNRAILYHFMGEQSPDTF
jgi:hypothetical protein